MPESDRPFRVLVVCTGNTCRSPMAEAMLRRMLEEAGVESEVRSAGTAAVRGGAHPYAIEATRGVDLDVTGHVAQPLTESLVRWADVVLGMGPTHVRAARSLDSTADVHLVTEFVSGGAQEGILDPIGYEKRVYDEVLEEIQAALDGFVSQRTGARRERSAETGEGR